MPGSPLPSLSQAVERPRREITMPFDLILRGGRVIDPSQKLSAERDIGIVGQKIAAILAEIPEREARQTLVS